MLSRQSPACLCRPPVRRRRAPGPDRRSPVRASLRVRGGDTELAGPDVLEATASWPRRAERRNRFLRIGVGSRKARLRELPRDRAEARAVAAPTGPGLKVPDALLASHVHAADEHLAVIRTGMPAPVAERRVLALRADLKRSPCTRKLVAAISTKPEHARHIDTFGERAESRPAPQQGVQSAAAGSSSCSSRRRLGFAADESWRV
jgi:hypothetical protein